MYYLLNVKQKYMLSKVNTFQCGTACVTGSRCKTLQSWIFMYIRINNLTKYDHVVHIFYYYQCFIFEYH